jgi:hypothetical protein
VRRTLQVNCEVLAAVGLPLMTNRALVVARSYKAPPWVQGLRCVARIVDFWSGGTTSQALFTWLERLGFEVTIDRSATQLGFTCGIVGARVAVDMLCAEDWATVEVSRAADVAWLKVANRELKLFSEDELAGAVSIATADKACTPPPLPRKPHASPYHQATHPPPDHLVATIS